MTSLRCRCTWTRTTRCPASSTPFAGSEHSIKRTRGDHRRAAAVFRFACRSRKVGRGSLRPAALHSATNEASSARIAISFSDASVQSWSRLIWSRIASSTAGIRARKSLIFRRISLILLSMGYGQVTDWKKGRQTMVINSIRRYERPSYLASSMASAIYSLPTISSCQAVSQTTRTTARWGLLPVTVELLDEIRQRQLPQFLTMIGELPEFVRVHFERACHLDMHARQVPAASYVDPRS